MSRDVKLFLIRIGVVVALLAFTVVFKMMGVAHFLALVLVAAFGGLLGAYIRERMNRYSPVQKTSLGVILVGLIAITVYLANTKWVKIGEILGVFWGMGLWTGLVSPYFPKRLAEYSAGQKLLLAMTALMMFAITFYLVVTLHVSPQ